MTDRVILTNLRFAAKHGVHAHEKITAQRFEVDVELELALAPAGRSDDLELTADYSLVAKVVADVLGGSPVDLIETLAERIAHDALGRLPTVAAVTVRVRKPEVRLVAPLDHASVEIRRTRHQVRAADQVS